MPTKKVEALKKAARKAYEKYQDAKMRRRCLEGKVVIAIQAEKNLRDIYERKKDRYDDAIGPATWLRKYDMLGGCRRTGGAWGSPGGARGNQREPEGVGGSQGGTRRSQRGQGSQNTHFVQAKSRRQHYWRFY